MDNWPKLQESWISLELEEKYEIKEYFNIIGDGFGDLMFKGDKSQVKSKFEEMSHTDALNCL